MSDSSSEVIVPPTVEQLKDALPAPKRGFNPLAAGVLGAFLGLIAGVAIGTQGAPKPAEARKPIVINVQINGQSAQIVGTPVVGNGMDGAKEILGQGNAKISMVEFGDYHCGYCRLYELETFPRLKAEFVDTGKVRYAYRHTVSVGGEQTVAVSNAALCVAEQGKFWAFHSLMFAQQARWEPVAPGPALNSTLASLSSQTGANSEQVTSCLAAQRHSKVVQDDITAAAGFGISGTPSFVINGYMFSGALPYEVYKEIFKQFGVS